MLMVAYSGDAYAADMQAYPILNRLSAGRPPDASHITSSSSVSLGQISSHSVAASKRVSEHR
jgi:hypothetical protein